MTKGLSPRGLYPRGAVVFLAAGLAALMPPVSTAGAPPPADLQRAVNVGGRPRSYLLHVPPGKGSRPLPLVLVFHGGASNAQATVRLTGFNELADREGFLVAYPSGTGRLANVLTWNAGACCGYAAQQRVDDVAFVRALLADVATAASLDAMRVYATGISNGGQMAYRLAAEMPDRIAAIAPVAGSLEVPMGAVSRPVSVMHFHGTDDENLPMAGGRGRRSIAGVAFQSVEHSVGAWVRANGCQATPAVEPIPDRFSDGTRVERRTYRECRQNSEVVLYVVEGGGHTWPGREIRGGLLGVSTREIMATDLMWRFFARHAIEK